MKKLIKQLLRLLIRIVPLPVYQMLVKRNPVGFFYHAVSDVPMPHVEHLYRPLPTVRFESALLYLHARYNFVSYPELHAHVYEGAPLPPKAVHLSFDDGFVECYRVVRPLLKKYAIPCTFFVATDWIDNQKLFYRNKVSLCIEAMTRLEPGALMATLTRLNTELELSLEDRAAFERWILALVQADEPQIDQVCEILGVDTAAFLANHHPFLTQEQIREMAAEGFTIGSHTRSHPKLVQVSPEEMEAEIVESSRIIQTITGQEIVPFSFPNSATGLDRDLLADIRVRHDFLGLFFDTKDLHQDADFMFNRIWGERRGFVGKGAQTNIPALLRLAYQEEAYENLINLLR